MSSSFNPRARVGRDHRHGRQRARRTGVSIHAPAWGATTGRHGTTVLNQFQSTRPRGARPRSASTSRRSSRFNPRARVGRDLFDCLFQPLFPLVSIHAPGWGATLRITLMLASFSMFQSTRPRGARHRRVPRRYSEPRFQSTRPRGARPATSWNRLAWSSFQSTRPRGARRTAPPIAS